jgi:YggT family protein
VALVVCQLLSLFVFAIIGRIILSFFPISEGSPMATVYTVLYTVTEPVLGPLRRVVPTMGMFDLSPMIVIIGVQILRGIIC